MTDKVVYLNKTEQRKQEFQENIWNYQVELASVIEKYFDKGVELTHLLIVMIRVGGQNMGLRAYEDGLSDEKKVKMLEVLIDGLGEDFLQQAFGTEVEDE